MNKKTLIALLTLIVIIRFASLFILPITDTTEARYALLVKEMAETNDYLTPYTWIDGKRIPYLGKPPLFFWLGALSIEVFGVNEFAPRLPSFLAYIFMLTIMFLILYKYEDKEVAINSTFVTATCGLFFILAGTVILDITLTLFSCGSVFLYFAYIKETKWYRKFYFLGIFVFLGLGFLTKGPVALIMFGLPVFFYIVIYKDFRIFKEWLWPLGLLLFAGIIVPWNYFMEKANPGFLQYFYVQENFLRFISSKYGDRYGTGRKFPYGTSIVMMLVGTAPWCIAWLYLLIKKKFQNKISLKEKTPFQVFFVGFIAITLFWCLARQLLFTYLLPAIPLWSVWACYSFKKAEIEQRKIVTFASILAGLYLVGLAIAYPITIRKPSTKKIVKMAVYQRKKLSLDKKIIFLPKPSYSAYYYADKITSGSPFNPKSNYLEAGKNYIYIIRTRKMKYLSQYCSRKLTKICEYGIWTLLHDKKQ